MRGFEEKKNERKKHEHTHAHIMEKNNKIKFEKLTQIINSEK